LNNIYYLESGSSELCETTICPDGNDTKISKIFIFHFLGEVFSPSSQK